MAEIFLSYRRQDSQSATGRLADDLEAHFGDERVFRDHEIAAGDDFVAAIRRSVESSTVILAVVGPRWLASTDAEGRRRLDDAGDFVRLEIELALAARVPVVPVLVDGAMMPNASALPPSLQAFARHQAVELTDRRWRFDVETLIAWLEQHFGIEAAPDATASGLATAARSPHWTRWAADLVDLALRPRRLIARRQAGRTSDYARAFAFLCGAILVGNAMLLTTIDIDLVARGSPIDVALAIGGWLVSSLLVGLLLATLLVGTLALAWRVVARRAVIRTVAVVGAHIYGGTWLGVCAGVVCADTAVAFVDADFLRHTVAEVRAAITASQPLSGQRLPSFREAPLGGVASVLLVVGTLAWLATLGWCIAAWKAFRQSLAASRAQAWLATSLWLTALAALVWLPTRI
ncbi:MAG: toll/interleukin-1 receptor domain-containing protein [Rhizobacter sp.]|nr:toll/interleukin-1 receptor domain-containing protein [Rhizobacter sp.]